VFSFVGRQTFPIISNTIGRLIAVLGESDADRPFNASKFFLNYAMDVIGAPFCSISFSVFLPCSRAHSSHFIKFWLSKLLTSVVLEKSG
jgi:hypothetical protein